MKVKLIEFELFLTFIGFLLGLLSFTSYLSGNLYPLTLYVSVFCLFGAKFIELADRMHFEWP